MSTENLVLRTVYVDADVDDQLRDEALHKQLSKADLFRKYLVTGIKAAKSHPDLRTLNPKNTQALVLRTIHMDPKLDDKLRVEAFDSRTSKNDLMRRYVQLGMSLEEARATGASRSSLPAAIKTEPAPGKKTGSSKRRQPGQHD
ncbi:hypothetical protein F2P45_28740 [Massilia sp. CCM 8733]|uniref:Uncharacterized protein n=1 Tax=Massilia mucilaginosa TaxID=2609282 RepID=A0ABX0P0Z9_9BURK|nr:hypothetical protein [Massilia mucilaginosa]NHZ92963.1 hypothetical protein [Massilia mucilaginosa]